MPGLCWMNGAGDVGVFSVADDGMMPASKGC